MLDVRCPGCAKLLRVVATATDRDSVCPACGIQFRPDAVWRDSDTPARTVAPEANVDELNDLEPLWNTRADPRVANQAVHGTASLQQLAKRGLAVGAMIMVVNAMAQGLLLDLGELALLGLVVCASTTLFAITYGLLLYNAPDDWHRWSFWTATTGAVMLFLSLNLYYAVRPGRPSAHIGVIPALVWICAWLGLGAYFLLSVAGRFGSGLAQLRQGFLKAAGRRTQPSRAEPPSRFDLPTDDEDLT